MRLICQRILRAVTEYGIPFLPKRAARIIVQSRAMRVARQNGFTVQFSPRRIQICRGSDEIILPETNIEYIFSILTHFDDYFSAVIPQIINGRNVVDYSIPHEHILRKSAIPLFFPSIAEDFIDGYLHHYRPKEGDIVFDIGAYCGVSAYHFSKMVGERGRVYAFEPDPSNFAALLRNIQTHHLKNVIPVQKGIWSKTTTLSFHSDHTLGSAISPLTLRPVNNALCKIEVLSLADACKEFGIVQPNFIKMDIEGAEIDVIEGALDFISSHTMHFSIASYHIVKGVPTCHTIEKLFRKAGYRVQSGKSCDGPDVGNLITWAWK